MKKIIFILVIFFICHLFNCGILNAQGVNMKINYIKNKKIMLDPGHGGTDSGAVRFEIKEKELNLKVAKQLEYYLNLFGAEVILTRTDDSQTVELNKRYDMISAYKPDIFISLHHNDTADKNYERHDFKNRTEVYFGLMSNCGKDTITLGKCFFSAFKRLYKIENAALIPGYFKVIRDPGIPSILMEPYYMGELNFLKTAGGDYYAKHEALCYFNAISEYFKIKGNLNSLDFEAQNELSSYNLDTCDIFINSEGMNNVGEKTAELLNAASIKTYINCHAPASTQAAELSKRHISWYYMAKILSVKELLEQTMINQYLLAIMSNSRNPKIHLDLAVTDSNISEASYYYRSERGKKIAQNLSQSIKKAELNIELKTNPDSFYLLSSTSAATVRLAISKKEISNFDSLRKFRLAVAIFNALKNSIN